MGADKHDGPPLEGLLGEPNLADVLESDRFKNFLDHVPVAVAVAELHPSERITYANLEFERLSGQSAAAVEGCSWDRVVAIAAARDDDRDLGSAILAEDDYIGAFQIEREGGLVVVDAWSNVIQNENGEPMFRLVALAEVNRGDPEGIADMQKRIRDKDTLLRELQHRVKNNLQMITALIRMETRNLPGEVAGKSLDRLAGRVESLALLYRSLSEEAAGDSVDLGIYLSQIASAVMQAHAVPGIRLDLKVDTWPVSVNVAMPTGLVVNELLTNALKHAFVGREGGTITLHSLVDDEGCRVIVADDGVGLPDADHWPRPGKLGALIVRSLRQNAKARVDVVSAPGEGVRVTIRFARADAEPEAGDER